MKKNDYLERILRARVYDVAQQTPLELAPGLSRRLGNRLLLKREDLQPVFSFKLRGAYNKMASLRPTRLKKGVIVDAEGDGGDARVQVNFGRQGVKWLAVAVAKLEAA